MENKTFQVPNIGCEACVINIKQKIGALDGVSSVEGDKATQTVSVQWHAPASWESIKQRLIEIDYPPEQV